MSTTELPFESSTFVVEMNRLFSENKHREALKMLVQAGQPEQAQWAAYIKGLLARAAKTATETPPEYEVDPRDEKALEKGIDTSAPDYEGDGGGSEFR